MEQNWTVSRRVIIGRVPNADLGRMYEAMFRQAGIPVTSVAAITGISAATIGPAELWLEDESLLEDPELAAFIDDVLNRDHSKDADAGQTTLDPVEPESPPTASWPSFWYVVALVASLALLPFLAWLCFLLFNAVYNSLH